MTMNDRERLTWMNEVRWHAQDLRRIAGDDCPCNRPDCGHRRSIRATADALDEIIGQVRAEQ
jgi:hypothetical protein